MESSILVLQRLKSLSFEDLEAISNHLSETGRQNLRGATKKHHLSSPQA